MITDIVLFLVGILIGLVNAVAAGGMLLGFPALLAAGLPPITANVTGKLVVFPSQLASAFGRREIFKQLPKRYLWLLLPLAAGTIAGAVILRTTPSSQFEAIVPWLVLAATIAFALQPVLKRRINAAARRKAVLPLAVLGLILLILSVYAGYFGAGFGFMLLALAGFSKLKNIRQMNAFKNLAGSISALVALIALASNGFFAWQAGLSMAAGSIIGGYLGARYDQKIPENLIRPFIIILGLITTIILAFRFRYH
ncbi:MAG: sulfite exporter TauE/SafE family protein [Candidatus Saccharimonadales bacterium]